jgi:hypothetical protein
MKLNLPLISFGALCPAAMFAIYFALGLPKLAWAQQTVARYYEYSILNSRPAGGQTMHRYVDTEKGVVCYRLEGGGALSCVKMP